MGSSGSGSKQHEPTLNGIWGELNKVLGGLDLNGASPEAGGPGNGQMGGGGNGSGSNASSNNEINKQFLSIGSRSSLDLGTLGRPLTDLAGKVLSLLEACFDLISRNENSNRGPENY